MATKSLRVTTAPIKIQGLLTDKQYVAQNIGTSDIIILSSTETGSSLPKPYPDGFVISWREHGTQLLQPIEDECIWVRTESGGSTLIYDEVV